MKSKSCFVFGLLASLVLYVRADYEVKVQLFTFENPTHQWPRNGDPPAFCCDGLGARDPCTGDICDVYVIFCLNPFELPFDDDSVTNCEPDTRVSEIFTTPNPTMDDDDITFDVGETALLGLPNPFIIHQTGEWPGGIQLVIHVFDDDSNVVSDNDDSLQRIIINIDRLGTSPPELIMGAVAMTNVSYEVACAEGFEGVNCELTMTDECAPDPCENGATCMDLFMNYTCKCVAGYEGNNCEIDINECDNNPCQNGASCTDLVAGYNCTCAEGYEGEDCSQETDECINQLEPCRNGATCVDLFLNYTCECADGYEGRDCGVEIDECDSNPCQKGGSCTDLVANYSCSCLSGFIGKNCEREESEGSSTSSEGVDVGTLAGGVVGLVLLVHIVLLVVVVLVFMVRKHRHKHVQITGGAHSTTAGTINMRFDQVHEDSTTQAQTSSLATPDVIALGPNPVYGDSAGLQGNTEYYVNEDMGPEEPPQYDYPQVQPCQ